MPPAGYARDVAAALATAVPGMAMRTVAPLAATVPPCRSAVARTIASPSPEPGRPRAPAPVSYTHLTLPTKA